MFDFLAWAIEFDVSPSTLTAGSRPVLYRTAQAFSAPALGLWQRVNNEKSSWYARVRRGLGREQGLDAFGPLEKTVFNLQIGSLNQQVKHV